MTKRHIAAASLAAVLLLAAVSLYATQAYWRGWLTGGGAAAANQDDHSRRQDDHAGHAHGEEDPNVLELSDEALETLAIETAPLARSSDAARTLRIPGQFAEIPGVTHRDVTAKASGEVAEVYVRPGQAISPGDPLFDVHLTHQEAITAQLELLDALAELEAVDAEIRRLEDVNRESPGAIAGARIIEKQLKRRHLYHTISSREQLLILLGLSKDKVADLIRRHREHHAEQPLDVEMEEHAVTLIENVTITALPASGADSDAAEPQTLFVVEEVAVHIGEHVDAGDLFCRLGDYRRLYVEGEAYERDLAVVRRVIARGWKASVALPERGDEEMVAEELPVLRIAPAINPTTRTARFYMELDNDLSMHEEDGRQFVSMMYRPGQRVEIRLPIEQFENAFVLPVDAVAQDGPENYIFQASGNRFVRRKVSVRFRDDEQVVLGEDARRYEGAAIVINAAYQLQLALLNRAAGPVDHGHHH